MGFRIAKLSSRWVKVCPVLGITSSPHPELVLASGRVGYSMRQARSRDPPGVRPGRSEPAAAAARRPTVYRTDTPTLDSKGRDAINCLRKTEFDVSQYEI